MYRQSLGFEREIYFSNGYSDRTSALDVLLPAAPQLYSRCVRYRADGSRLASALRLRMDNGAALQCSMKLRELEEIAAFLRESVWHITILVIS